MNAVSVNGLSRWWVDKRQKRCCAAADRASFKLRAALRVVPSGEGLASRSIHLWGPKTCAAASSAKTEPAASLLPPKPPPCRGGGAVVAASAEFDAAVDEAEVEPVNEAALAALLAKAPDARPPPFAIAMTRSATRSAMACATLSPTRRRGAKSRRGISPKAETRGVAARCVVNDYAQE